METVVCVLLGVVQGLTEFLPVSSSGHLALGEQAFGLQPRLHLAAALHFGTLLVVVFWFRHDLRRIGADLWEAVRHCRTGQRLSDLARKEGGVRTTLLVFLACIPTAAVGLAVESVWAKMAASTVWVSGLLLVTAALLLSTRLRKQGSGQLTVTTALIVGLVQGLAAAPGISRSGATIAVALLCGAGQKQATRFSFFIAIPAILGACVLEAKSLLDLSPSSVVPLLMGVAVSMVAGYFALSVLVKSVVAGRLHWYSVYLVPVALGGLALSIWGR